MCRGGTAIVIEDHNQNDELPSSIYVLKKAFSLDVDVVKYCAVCLKVTELCDNKQHKGICRHMILPFEEQMKRMYEGAFVIISQYMH